MTDEALLPLNPGFKVLGMHDSCRHTQTQMYLLVRGHRSPGLSRLCCILLQTHCLGDIANGRSGHVNLPRSDVFAARQGCRGCSVSCGVP